MFALNFSVTTAVALTFLLIGAFVFWRRPTDARCDDFRDDAGRGGRLANTALLPIEGDGYRGIVGGDQSLGALWRLILVGGSSLFFAPLLLHTPGVDGFRPNGPAMQRPGILRWIYGYPLMMCLCGGVAMSFIAYLSAFKPKGDLITNAAIIAVGVLGVGALIFVIVNIARYGLKEGVMRSPLAIAAVVLSLFAGIFSRATYRAESRFRFHYDVHPDPRRHRVVRAYPVATFVAISSTAITSGVEERRQVKWPLYGRRWLPSAASFCSQSSDSRWCC